MISFDETCLPVNTHLDSEIVYQDVLGIPLPENQLPFRLYPNPAGDKLYINTGTDDITGYQV